MKVYLKDIREEESTFDFTEDTAWVLETCASVDESMDSQDLGIKPPDSVKNRPIKVHFGLRRVQDCFVVQCQVHTTNQLLCSRCACEFDHLCDQQFSGLFTKNQKLTDTQDLRTIGHPDQAIDEDEDLDITYLTEDYIDLNELLLEQIRLSVPYQPLCKSDCKGICQTCGAELNRGQCACARIHTNPSRVSIREIKHNH